MKSATTLLALVMTVAIAACAPPAVPPAPMAGTPADEQAIRDLMQRISTAWNAKDAAAMVAMVTDDYQAINPEGRHTQGKAAYEATTTTEFEAPRPEGMALSIDTGYVQWHSADVAAVGGTWSVTGLPAGTPGTNGSWIVVVKRSGDQWLMSNGLVATFVPPPAGGN
ncbi:MAG TPA: SgcJ/EcaC family oxidoreductase [Vicinamibacterales bacterium]|nr:SgcJ/EcaC family oxidoreductase [Vicinamibacterales bacterium]